ncbi:MAG: response regulator [Acidobacteriia bacterium]|nr:response regulator [Terriglobia bacterium]
MARSADLQFNRPCSFLPRGRVLLVDEDGNDLRYYTALLWRLGYVVRPFASYQEAESCLQREPIDFIMVNQGSPAFEARGLVERALARNRRTPVVVLTHCLDMSCYLEAMQLGAVDYLEKPLAPADVEHLVTTHAQPGLLEMRGHRA